MWNAECGISTTHNLQNIMWKKLAEFSIVYSVTKVVVYYLLNKHMATFTIVPYCQQIAKHSASVIPQSIHGRILHAAKYFHPTADTDSP